MKPTSFQLFTPIKHNCGQIHLRLLELFLLTHSQQSGATLVQIADKYCVPGTLLSAGILLWETLLRENPQLHCCSYGVIQANDHNAGIYGKDRMIITSCSKLFRFLCNPASLLGSFYLLTLAYDMEETWWHHGSLPALISTDTCREHPCFQSVSLQVFGYNRAQALPASSTHNHKMFPNKAQGKENKNLIIIFFLKQIVWGNSLIFLFWTFRLHFVCFYVLFHLPLLLLPNPFPLHPKHKG